MEKKSSYRTLESIRSNIYTSTLEYGSEKAPLFDLPTHRIITGELLPLLRIMDVLIQALLNTAKVYDHHSTHGIRRRHSFKPQDGPMIQNLVRTIESCRVKFYVWEDKKGDALLWPSLLENDKKKLLRSLPSKVSNRCQPPHLVNNLVKLLNVS